MKKAMAEFIITPLNVIPLTNFLLSSDSSRFKIEARHDMRHFSEALQKALDNFQKLPPQTGSQTLDFDFHLSSLVESARNFYAVLTDDAKAELHRLLDSAESKQKESAKVMG